MSATGTEITKVEGLRKMQPEMVIHAWADARTDANSDRRIDLLRDKTRVVSDFFEFAGVTPNKVKPEHIKAWQVILESRGLVPSTVYGMISRLSSFFEWIRQDPQVKKAIPINPVDYARPKSPGQYKSESLKSLTDDELNALIEHVKSKADSGCLIGLRDYALLLHFALTGRRRAEVISLKWQDIQTNGAAGMLVRYKVKGGDFEHRHVDAPSVKKAMMDYLRAAGRLEKMRDGDAIWTAHNQSSKSKKPITSHAIALNFKRYAKAVGIKDFHLHSLRHTYARQGGDLTGSESVMQDALGHSSPRTTRIYLGKVGIKRDVLGEQLELKLGIEK